MNNSCTFIIFLCVAVSVLLLIGINNAEKFGFPFHTLHTKPRVKYAPIWYQGYCSKNTGEPIPCNVPCRCSKNPACKFQHPNPVFGVTSGSHSPSKWCPGAPLC